MTMMLTNRKMTKPKPAAPPTTSASLRAAWNRHEAAAIAVCADNPDAYAEFLTQALPAVLASYVQLQKPKKE